MQVDKDIQNIFNDKQEILLRPAECAPENSHYIKKVVAKSLTILSDSEFENETSYPTEVNRSFKVELSHLPKWLFDADKRLDYAQRMYNEIKNEVENFYFADPPRNRKERRTRAKKLKIKINRFNAFCKDNGIEISSR